MFMKLWDNNLVRRTFMVLGAIILVGAVALAQGCSRQMTPQEQRAARGDVPPTGNAEWEYLNKEVKKVNDNDGTRCYVYNPHGADSVDSASRWSCVRS